MAKKINIALTDDPLINIHSMIPILNDKEREAISYLMYGYYLGSTQDQSPKNPSIEERNQDE